MPSSVAAALPSAEPRSDDARAILLLEAVIDRRPLEQPATYRSIGTIGSGSSYTEPPGAAELVIGRIAAHGETLSGAHIVTDGAQLRALCSTAPRARVARLRLTIREFQSGWRTTAWDYVKESTASLLVSVRGASDVELTRFVVSAEETEKQFRGITASDQAEMGRRAIMQAVAAIVSDSRLSAALANLPPSECAGVEYAGSSVIDVGEPFPPPSAKAAPPSPVSGSGFLLTTDGLVATNNHVIAGGGEIHARLSKSGATYLARVVLQDAKNDLAVLQLDGFPPGGSPGQHLPYCLRSAASLRLGDAVFTLGFPLGSELGSGAKLSLGTVSSLAGLGNDPTRMQVSLPVQPGNSGGAVWTSTGDLVGVVVATLDPSEMFVATGGALPQNVNFAIKSDYLLMLLQMTSTSQPIDVGSCEPQGTRALPDVVQAFEPYVLEITVGG